jgi:hypothetical protein
VEGRKRIGCKGGMKRPVQSVEGKAKLRQKIGMGRGMGDGNANGHGHAQLSSRYHPLRSAPHQRIPCQTYEEQRRTAPKGGSETSKQLSLAAPRRDGRLQRCEGGG